MEVQVALSAHSLSQPDNHPVSAPKLEYGHMRDKIYVDGA